MLSHKEFFMKRSRKFSVLLSVSLAFCTLLAFTSCDRSHEKEAVGEPPDGVSVDSYAAETVFSEVARQVENHPNDADAVYHLADLYFRADQYDKAVEYFKRVVEIAPERGYSWLKLGTSLSRLERHEEAVVAFGKAAGLLPDPALAYNNMAIALGKLGRYEEERDVLLQAIASRPNYAAARANLAVTYLRLNDRQRALEQQQALSAFNSTLAGKLLEEINTAMPEGAANQQ